MAGSRSRFNYVSDSGTNYTLVLDESNGRASAGGIRITGDAAALANNKPSGFTPRYILCYLTANPRIRRRFVVGDPDTVPALLTSGATLSAAVYANSADTAPTPETWTISSYRGEKFTLVPGAASADTGLQEGTP